MRRSAPRLDKTTVWKSQKVHIRRSRYSCAPHTLHAEKAGSIIVTTASFHHAEIASSCIFFVPTTKHQSGSAAFRFSHLCQTRTSVEGREMMTAIWSSSGCALIQPQMQFRNCFHASACVPANCQAACALSMDWHAPTRSQLNYATLVIEMVMMIELMKNKPIILSYM